MAYPTARTHTIIEPIEGREFRVARENVLNSRVGNKNQCAAACALRETPGIIDAWVFRSATLLLREDGIVERFKNPAVLTSAVESFDSTAGVFPEGSYALMPLTRGQRTAARNERNARNPERATLGVRPVDHGPRRPAHALR